MTAAAAADPAADMREVVLRRFPLRVHARNREQHDALMRELSILALDTTRDDADVPRRLTELVESLVRGYRASSEPVEEVRDAAFLRGEREIELTYRVPAAVVGAVDALEELLHEADAFCRSDRYLLTLSSSEEARAFRAWFFEEFRRQVAGKPPTPWPGGLD